MASQTSSPSLPLSSRLGAWVSGNACRRSLVLAAVVYALATLVYALVAAPDLFEEHTSYNHFAHLAHSWLNGQLDLPEGPPRYARNNDFAQFEDRWFVTFPPLPALLLLPFVAVAGEPELVRDGLVFLCFAGTGPACLFLALERLRTLGHSRRTEVQNLVLVVCFAFGTVFFFTVLQGTVWFAAHTVSVAFAALYLLFSIDARRPVLAGLMLGLGYLTRAPLLFTFPLFLFEAWRTCNVSPLDLSAVDRQKKATLVRCVLAQWQGLDKRQFLKLGVAFSLPVVACLLFSLWHNWARFGDPFENGYRYLTVAWQARMNKWGLFHYHYLAKNLGVMLTSLPWYEAKTGFRVNVHGLALWFTTPLYFWLLWPAVRPKLHWPLWLTIACVALPSLFYQNTGWAQFGYRFSNDYAVFLFALLAIGSRPMKTLFTLAAVWSLLVNSFGASTFQRDAFKQYYYWDGSQKTLYQPD